MKKKNELRVGTVSIDGKNVGHFVGYGPSDDELIQAVMFKRGDIPWLIKALQKELRLHSPKQCKHRDPCPQLKN